MSQKSVVDKILVDHYYHKNSRKRANEIVHKFIIDKQLVVTGGLVIDYALRLKGDKIYEDFAVPDYDFFSTHNARDACELFELLRSSGFTDISLLPGIHPSTIKIFVYKDCVADITFAYKELFAEMKSTALKYNGILFRNPNIQYADMHRSLSYPYENEPKETINNRWVKDFERFCKLYRFYKITESAVNTQNMTDKTTDIDFDYVVAGQYAINFYLNKYEIAKSHADDAITYLMDDKDRRQFMTKYGKDIKDLKLYKAYNELLPERSEMYIKGLKHIVLHCNNKTGIYNIGNQETVIKDTLKNARLRLAKPAYSGGNDNKLSALTSPGYASTSPGYRIVGINFCVIYCYSMFRITGNNAYWHQYGTLLGLIYKAYSEGIVDLYPAITVYGEELDKPIIVYTSEHPEAKVSQVHISADNEDADNEDQIAKLPWDFKYEKSVYILDGSLIG